VTLHGSGTGSSVSVVNRSSTADVVSRVCEVQAEQTARREADRSLGSPAPSILENEGQPSLSRSESGTIGDSNIGPNTQLKEEHTATSRPQPGLIPECANLPVFSAFPQRNFGKQQQAFCSSWYSKYPWLHNQQGDDMQCSLLLLHGGRQTWPLTPS